MSEMIERVAKAIFSSQYASSYPQAAWESASHLQREGYRQDAVAAIEAMRAPTEAMIKESLVEADKHGYMATKGYYGEEEANFTWSAMIAAALSEDGTTEETP